VDAPVDERRQRVDALLGVGRPEAVDQVQEVLADDRERVLGPSFEMAPAKTRPAIRSVPRVAR
jgi:hypothetical protein